MFPDGRYAGGYDDLRPPSKRWRAPTHDPHALPSRQSFPPAPAAVPVPPGQESGCWNAEEFDKGYFSSYSHLGIHEAMIKDRARTDAYKAAVMRHQKFIEGKVVMDVGCGTGILAIFCAQAGAKQVYAVEASDIAAQANQVVIDNGLSDKITVLHERVENIEIDGKVDVIISEWMGYMLLYESMLTSVIFARDKWLKPDGLILPSHATLYLAPITDVERYLDSIDFWHDVYGINMSAIVPHAKQCAFEEPCIDTIGGENVLAWPCVVKNVDCYRVSARELECFTTKYKFTSIMQAPLHGFAFWFDVEFNGPSALFPENQFQLPPGSSTDSSSIHHSHRKNRVGSDEMIVLSTSPEDAPTHWQQTLLFFYDPMEVHQDQVIEGSVTISQSKENPRFLNIHLEYASEGRHLVKESVLR